MTPGRTRMPALFTRAVSKSALFQYRGSRFIYLGIKAFIQTIFHYLPDVITIPTPYGKFVMHKTARILSTMLDLVESQAQEFFYENIKNAKVFVDVGAAYGWYTLKAARIMKKPHILSIEPDDRFFVILQANIRLSMLGCVTPVKMALADEDGYTKLCGRKVRCKRLDGLLRDLSISYSDVDFIKIDVEGMAVKVLRGMNETLRQGKPALLIELHRGEDEVPELLKKHGYKIEPLPGLIVLAVKS
jgi:hypothetical protein